MPTHSPIQYGTPIHSVTLSAPGVQGLTAIKDAAGSPVSPQDLPMTSASVHTIADWRPAYRLYVIEFRNGVVKAGITTQPGDARIRQYVLPIARYFYTPIVAGFAAEGELLRRLARIGCLSAGREWFTGVTFAQARQIASQLALRYPSDVQAVAKNPATRKTVTKLSFNDRELAVLDAYAKHVGKPRSVAARELAMDVISGLSHAEQSAFF